MPAPASAASLRLPGSVVHGCGSCMLCSMPRRPATAGGVVVVWWCGVWCLVCVRVWWVGSTMCSAHEDGGAGMP